MRRSASITDGAFRPMRGESHRTAKFTEAQAQAILDAVDNQAAYALADQFKMNRSYALAIRRRKTWRHLKRTVASE